MLVTNATLVTWEAENRVTDNGALLIENDRINKTVQIGGFLPPFATIGQLISGAFADIIFLDYQLNTPLTTGKLPWHIILGIQQRMTTTTIVAGKVLMKDRQLQALDEKEISPKAREVAPNVWERYNMEEAKVL